MKLRNTHYKSASQEFYKHNRIKGLATETQKAYQVYVDCFIITRLTKYNTKDWTYAVLPFSQNENFVLNNIEFDKETGVGYLLGFTRRISGLRKGEIDYGFLSQLIDDEMVNLKRLDASTYEYTWAYRDYEESGFTEKN